jgi:pimeloyl-ACP methyl ester carboxylesterase
MAVGGATAGIGQTGTTEGVGSMFGSVFGGIGQFLNLTTWYVMKNRAGVVGAAGVAQAVRDLKTATPAVKIHLVGHSLGGRLMAGCAKSLAQTNSHVESLSLLEAAFSHYGFSPNNGKGQAGFFRNVIDNKVVTGPFIATYSAQDTVVGTVYAVASRLASDSVQQVGDANDPYGGIGRNGAQKTAESVSGVLHAVGTPYQFQIPKVNCLDGSGGLIKDHGDVANAFVTYAFASVVSNT